jgi:predicted MPP superfamily phosphohydrolase
VLLARTIFFILVLFALLGDARIFFFIMNRVIFGSHRHEKSPWMPLLYIAPPVLLFLTGLFWPLHQWITRIIDRPTPALARLGAFWLVAAAGTGIYWVIDKIRLNATPERVSGVSTDPPEIIRLRKAHMPIAILRRLGAHNDIYDIEVTHHAVFVDDLPDAFDGYRIAFLTDTHVAGIIRKTFYREIVAQVTRFDPDLVLLGGDFVTWHRHIPLMAELLLPGLAARDGVLAVLGNHDYWSGADDVKAAMTAHGVEFIINRSKIIRRGGAELPVVGIDEIYRGEPDPEAAFAGIGRGPRVALTHHPDSIDILQDRRVDLLLCGHTHGGQIRFPFFGAVVVPSMHETRYAEGFHRAGGVLMYVSRGIGAIPPVRILCRPEVATFTLRKGSRTR